MASDSRPVIITAPEQHNAAVFAHAVSCMTAGYSVIPIDPRPDRQGGKAPPCKWKRYQTRPAGKRTLEEWFRGTPEPRHLAIVCGPVSNNLIVLDFEAVDIAEEIERLFPELFPEYGHLIPGTTKTTTPRGRHWYLHVSDPPADFPNNEQLAYRPDADGKLKILIETRARGGYVVAPPAPGRDWIHPTGERVQWPWDAVAKLMNLCKASGHAPWDSAPEGKPRRIHNGTHNAAAGERPGDRFIRETDWPAILEPHGWHNQRGRHWRRPGKDGNATSAVITPSGNLYVFSTNADHFQANQSFTKFRAHSLLNHAGDDQAAAKALAKAYGMPPPRLQEIDQDNARTPVTITADESTLLATVMAVIKDDERLFRLENALVTPCRRDADHGTGPVSLRDAEDGFIRAIITDRCELMKPDKAGELVPAGCPAYLPTVINASAGNADLVPFRSIIGLINGPTIDQDGNLINRRGHARIRGTGWYVSHGIPELDELVPEEPTHADATDAADRLYKLLDDFPWKDRLGPLKWITALLAQVGRPLFDRCPASLITANAPGSGKTLLARMLGIIAHGDEPPLMAWPAGRADDAEEETRKRLGALAAGGVTLAIIDNLRAGAAWDSDCLNNSITSGSVVDRQLGSNSAASLTPRRFITQLLATGNNVTAAGDLADRCLTVELETIDANRREISTDGYTIGEASRYAQRHRPELLAAALTMLSAYIKAGRPSTAGAAWGNFDEFVGLVVGAVRWAIGTDPLADRVTMAQRADPVASALLALCHNWFPAFGDLPITAKTIADRTAAPDADDKLSAIGEALAVLGCAKATGHAVGKTLQRFMNRIIADPSEPGSRYRITNARGGHDHTARWSVNRL